MKISLIGMASVGKSYWSKRFAAAGFVHIDLDDLIRQRLVAKLNRPLSTTTLMNEWLDYPDSEGFAEREQLFIETEAEVFQYTLSELEKAEAHIPMIIDTGGSLVYSPTEYWHRLKQYTTVIHLKIDKSLYKVMANTYLTEGRSVIWKGAYKPLAGEPRHESYLRCYAKLVDVRENFYVQYADCEVAYAQHRDRSMSIDDFLKLRKN